MVPMFTLAAGSSSSPSRPVSRPFRLAACRTTTPPPTVVSRSRPRSTPWPGWPSRSAARMCVVHSLTEPGAEPHDLELTPADVASVVDADLVVYLAGFQPAVDDAVDQADDAGPPSTSPTRPTSICGRRAVEDGHETVDGSDAVDPHFWLDPIRLGTVATALAEQPGRHRPRPPRRLPRRSGRRARCASTTSTTASASGSATCDRRELVTSHDAFGYLARRYDLQQVGIAGLTPEAEPSPADLAEVTDFVARPRRHARSSSRRW